MAMVVAKRWLIKAPTWKRRKRKTKIYGDQDKGINRGFGFGGQDT
jgi:hypothetical protein